MHAHNTHTHTACFNGDVRLVRGSVPQEGAVEVCTNNTWDTVCDGHWDKRDADIVCRQLGYRKALFASYWSFFKEGIVTPAVRRYLNCTGNESTLLDCPQLDSELHCNAAGVLCAIDDVSQGILFPPCMCCITLLLLTGVYFTHGSNVITANNTEVLITEIGDDFRNNQNDLQTLVCHTDLLTCCRSSHNNYMGLLGEWHYPDGRLVNRRYYGESFYPRWYGAQMVVLIHDISNNPLSPTGSYCCIIPTTKGNVTFCANLGEQSIIIPMMHRIIK